ncbi:hypothetical protein [Aminobacterium mobile]|jgi:hypothetical protein|uniref:hypothetical protein n=1 Tax=Aminobacterium mobile TaxID=81467 RepID=UPI0004636239|nr:hypothetical protein [Aminobacterium mobile]
MVKRCGAVAAAFLAAALLFVGSPLYGAVKIKGMQPWMQGSAEKSLNAVWQEMESTVPLADRLSMLTLVAERLFLGYSIKTPQWSGTDVLLPVSSTNPILWQVHVIQPVLPYPTDQWFYEDTKDLQSQLLKALDQVPVEALGWADMALKQEIEALSGPRLPGWDVSLQVQIDSEGGGATLNVAFLPQQPLVLAITPTVQSSSLPVAFQSDLKDNLQSGLFPVIGLPVQWVDVHKKEVEELARQSLAGRNIVENSKAQVDVAFKPSQIAKADAVVESPRFTIQAWAAAYGGTDDRYPELGLHVGRKALPLSGWDVELYGEWILSTNDWGLESRWGARWRYFPRLLFGVELAYPGEEIWWRFWLTGKVKQPYFWVRFSENSEKNMGVGYRLNEFLSIELHYDERDDDQWSIRAVGNL